MLKISELLSGVKLLEIKQSLINGELAVVKTMAWGTYIKGGGLTQSGGIARDIWKKPLNQISKIKYQRSNILILGLGGGKVIEVLDKYWPESKITGVDIDPVIVELGKKHLGLDEKRVNIVIGDAYDFVNKNLKLKNKNYKSKVKNDKYDLILVDLYVGDNFPEKFETENYIQLVRAALSEPGDSKSQRLSRGGVAVFNRLYYDEKRAIAKKFEKKLEKVFGKDNVDVVFPEANVMYICKE
jgi:spermidine synthase